MKDSLGDRMKGNYEDRSRTYLLRKTPVIIRVDGKAFHTLTRKAAKPFDVDIIEAMRGSAIYLASQMQGFKAGYVQSDEASFLLEDTDTVTTDAWFDNNLQKLVSVSASIMTAAFNRSRAFYDYSDRVGLPANTLPFFDARAFNIPETEVANYFLWRAKDWERNSVSMYARSFYSHKTLHGLGRKAVVTKLESDGHRWDELSPTFKNGSWIKRNEEGIIDWDSSVAASYPEISNWLSK